MDKDGATSDDEVGVASVDILPYLNQKGRITVEILSGEEEKGKLEVSIELREDGGGDGDGEEDEAEKTRKEEELEAGRREKERLEEEKRMLEKEIVERQNKIGKISSMKVFVNKGKVFEKQDVLSKGDPYVVIKYNGIEKKTKVIPNTLDPEWGEGVCTVLECVCIWSVLNDSAGCLWD
jgi:hypothetical protein